MPRLVQANGESMPFRDATFDAVLMIQVVGALHGWRPLADEARRVLRPSGSLMLGRVIAPVNAIDARMRERLTSLLATMDVRSRTTNARDEALRWLQGAACSHERIIAATWFVEHTPGAFIERHRTGARFSALPTPVQSQALRGLAAWASAAFGSLDSVSSEPREFELLVYKFDVGTDRKCGT
jgi:SAM-dependent methyltransferase